MRIDLYSDGGCSGNPGPGGWACIRVIEKEICTYSGNEEQTTNNRMELTAVIRGLESLSDYPVSTDVHITTDSQYVQLGITKWIRAWEKNGWRTTDKKPVKNQDLWVRLRGLTKNFTVTWAWVKGHAGHPMNEACDRLVQDEIKKLRF
jgi:ribonuclease HI